MKYDTDSDESLETFVKGAALLARQKFAQENYELYTELLTPITVGFFKDFEAPECKIMEKVASKRVENDKPVFAWVNAVTLAGFLDYVGLKDAKTSACGYLFEKDAR